MGMTVLDLTCVDCGRTWTWRAYNTTHKPHRCSPCAETHRKTAGKRTQRTARLKRYGLTQADYDALRADQSDRCAICGEEPPTLFIDHCHRSSSVRGLLCSRCNTFLGYLERGGFDLIEPAQRYLCR